MKNKVTQNKTWYVEFLEMLKMFLATPKTSVQNNKATKFGAPQVEKHVLHSFLTPA